MNFPLQGGCLCGNVRYTISERPLHTAICHCASCRRAAGAQSVGWAVVARDAFRCDGSELRHFQSSPAVERTFCGTCGSTISYRRRVQTIDVTLGTLDDPEALPPTEEVWCEARLSWNPAHPDLEQHERDG